MTDTKRCPHCGRTLDLDQFWARADSRDGRQSRCKDCARQTRRAAAPRPATARDHKLHAARSTAISRLQALHADDYRRLYLQAKAERGLIPTPPEAA